MSYTATKYLSFKPFNYPAGHDFTGRSIILRGLLADCDTATMYTTGGIGSTSFEATAFSAAGLVTYTALLGAPLYNGQRVVLFNFASNTNDGTYIVSTLTPTSSSAGTFVAVPLPGKSLAASAQTTQTAQGVGQLQFGIKYPVAQTFTASAVAVAGNIMTVTYTTLTGPQLTPPDSVTLAGMTNAGNNGTFSLIGCITTSATGGSFRVINANAKATDSGTGKGNFIAGSEVSSAAEVPVQVQPFTSLGYIYVWDATNYTIRIFKTGTSADTILNEAALAGSVTLDITLTCEVVMPKFLPQ